MIEGFLELAVVILLSAVFGVLVRMAKQPMILAYLAAGVVIGFFGFFNLEDQETFRLFSDLGIMFLLFLVGLEINYTQLRYVGKDALIIGLSQTVFTFLFGFLFAQIFSYELISSLYIALALTFSSTIIIVNLLSEKKDLNNLYGKLSIGMLLVQDFIAVIILVALAGGSESFIKIGESTVGKIFSVGLTFIIAIVVFALAIWLGRKIIPFIFEKVARSGELVFLVSLAWLFLLANVVSNIGLSIEIGGFLAGITLANSYENFQIANRIRPLRDFFILIFFVLLGSSIVISDFSGLGFHIIILSLFVLIGNPLIVLILMGLLGYKKRTSFLSGITIAQISEFSLVLVALGMTLGHVGQKVLALVTAIGIVTFTISTYFVIHAEKIYSYLLPYLGFFERKHTKKEMSLRSGVKKSIIIAGFHRTGQSIALCMPLKDDLLVVDYDPDMISELESHGIAHIFGDITDPEVLLEAHVRDARVLISTSPDFDANLLLLSQVYGDNGLKRRQRRPQIIMRARTEDEAKRLYNAGADYVLLPHFTSGRYLADILRRDPNLATLARYKADDLETLKFFNRP